MVGAAGADPLRPRSENIGCPALELRLPRRDLIGVDVKLLGKLCQRPIALDGGIAPPSP